MKSNSSKSSPSQALRWFFLGWVLLLAVIAGSSALNERQRLLGELQSEANALHRQASQRADQHDAHLTSLSALAVAGTDERPDLFLDVAHTILRFYPRIEAVDLVSLNSSATLLSSRTNVNADLAPQIRNAARSSTGKLVLLSLPDTPERYLLVKRSPNSDQARFGLALQVDAGELLTSDSAFWARPSVSKRLLLPDGHNLVGGSSPSQTQFRKVLGSSSQPLIMEAGISPGLTDLFPPGQLLAIMAVASLLYMAAFLGLRQFMRARQAEKRAQLSAQEVRLAHALRVNALGEMASGMAHELTQPLTAILSQAQAGRHLATRAGADDVAPVLNDIAGQAKRASAILDRLRNWTRPRSSTSQTTSVSDAVRGVEQLLKMEADRAGVQMQTGLEGLELSVRADPVELEQVIFNLARNAIEAASGSRDHLVTISASRAGKTIHIDVSDSGPGVPADLRPRLFEPFVTGKPDGTGLGLALCSRLTERMGGELSLVEDREKTVFRLTLRDAGGDVKDAAE